MVKIVLCAVLVMLIVNIVLDVVILCKITKK